MPFVPAEDAPRRGAPAYRSLQVERVQRAQAGLPRRAREGIQQHATADADGKILRCNDPLPRISAGAASAASSSGPVKSSRLKPLPQGHRPATLAKAQPSMNAASADRPDLPCTLAARNA